MKTRYVIIDSETNSLPDWKLPADAPGQPRVASLAIIILNEDLSVESEQQFLIKPDGWELTEGAAAVNGLTMERLLAEGLPIKEALEIYSRIILEGCVIIAWGARFDLKMMRGELRRAGMPDLFEQTPNVCLMMAATPICKLPGKRGFKWPKLSEGCAFFKVVLEGAHSAIGDARATVEILRHLVALKALPEPDVHYAANRPDGAAAPAKPVEPKADTKEEAY